MPTSGVWNKAEERIRGVLERFEGLPASPARLRAGVGHLLLYFCLAYGLVVAAQLMARLPGSRPAMAALVGLLVVTYMWGREASNPDFTPGRVAVEVVGLAAAGFALGGPLPILLLLYARQSFRSLKASIARTASTMVLYAAIFVVVAALTPRSELSLSVLVGLGSGFPLVAVVMYTLWLAFGRLELAARREQTLRKAASLAAADAGIDGRFTRGIPVALQLLPEPISSGLALFVRDGDHLVKVTGAGLLMGEPGSLDLSSAPAALSRAARGQWAPGPFRDPRIASYLREGRVEHAFVAPLEGGEEHRVLLAVSKQKPSPETCDALTTFALTMSMALEGTTLSRRLQERRSEKRFRSLIQNSSDVMMVVGQQLDVLYLSPAMDKVFGGAAPAPGSLEELVHPLDLNALKRAIKEAAARGHSDPIECRVRGRGEWVDAEVIATDLTTDPDVQGIVLNARDITERKRLEARLRHQAFHDPLTGLANRSLFSDRAKHALTLSRRRGEPVSILFLDIDDFKKVNETKGHPTGDTILKRVAERLSDCIRPSDTIGRMDGDEFALLLEDTDVEGAEVVARRVREALVTPIEIDDGDIVVSACLGIATSLGDEASIEDILRRADLAMHTAKRQNRGRIEVFEPGTYNDILRRFELEFEIERAIDEDEFYVEYQPIFDIKSYNVWGVEALVRWRHPVQGTIPPVDFITAAESTGAIVALERLVIREACEQGVRWMEAGRAVKMSVNLSPRHLAEKGFVHAITNILSTTGMPPSLLMLEITESVMADDSGPTIAKLQDLKDVGVSVGLDDFGTGYSSLRVLQNLPIDVLKIDRTFIEPLGGIQKKSILAPALLRIARTLDLHPIAEGVETQEQLDELRRLGCPYAQGFHLGRPVPANELFMFADERSLALSKGLLVSEDTATNKPEALG